jgi:hypothetical protein
MIKKAKELLKGLFLTKEGWISWGIANVITSLPWAIFFILGFLLSMPNLYVIGASIWTFMMLPITPFWILNVFIAYFFLKLLNKKKA